MWNFEGVTLFSKETYVFMVYWSNFLNVSSQIMPPAICLCWKHFGAAYHCRPPTFTPRHHSVCDEVQTRGRLFEMILTSRSTRIPIPKTHRFIHMFLGGRSTEKSLQLKVMIIKGILMMHIYTWNSKLTIFWMAIFLKDDCFSKGLFHQRLQGPIRI